MGERKDAYVERGKEVAPYGDYSYVDLRADRRWALLLFAQVHFVQEKKVTA